MKQLTAHQNKVLQLIGRHVAAHGYGPSLREIHGDLFVSNDVVKRLERKGYVTRGPPGSARTLRLTEKGLPYLLLSQLEEHEGVALKYLPLEDDGGGGGGGE